MAENVEIEYKITFMRVSKKLSKIEVVLHPDRRVVFHDKDENIRGELYYRYLLPFDARTLETFFHKEYDTGHYVELGLEE